MENLHILSEIIKNRRSIKPANFIEGSKVPDSVINTALENAIWAPTHGNTQPWEFIVYTGEALKTLNEFESELFRSENGDVNPAKYESLKNRYKKVSHSIAICYRKTEFSRIPEIEEIEAVACAVQNLALSISAAGYGGMWSSGGITYSPNAKKFFGLGENDKLLGFYLVGEIAKAVPPGIRKPVSEKVRWNR